MYTRWSRVQPGGSSGHKKAAAGLARGQGPIGQLHRAGPSSVAQQPNHSPAPGYNGGVFQVTCWAIPYAAPFSLQGRHRVAVTTVAQARRRTMQCLQTTIAALPTEMGCADGYRRFVPIDRPANTTPSPPQNTVDPPQACLGYSARRGPCGMATLSQQVIAAIRLMTNQQYLR